MVHLHAVNADTASGKSWLAGVAACLICASIAAQEVPSSPVADTSQTVEYSAEYFSRYQPNTALDMVRQLPGFQLNDGADNRGFAASAGNLLINGRRLSAKQDLPSATLARIPFSQVEKIELIRGQTAGIDLQGQSVIANVWLKSDIPASVRWQVWLQQNNAAPTKPGGNISMSDRIGSIDFNTGIDMERDTSGWYGFESLYDADGNLIESGTDDSTEKGFRINTISLNASSWVGENFVQMNTKFYRTKTNYFRPTHIVPVDPLSAIRDVNIDTDTLNKSYELGADVERTLVDTLTGKAILLYTQLDQGADSTQDRLDSIRGRTLLRIANTDTRQTERIARLEFDWAGWPDQTLQLNLEQAVNVLDRSLLQTDDRGTGPVPVSVPGANSRVREERYDFLLQDNWSRDIYRVEVGLGAESSTLAQTGDANLSRDFFFFKPHAILGYVPEEGRQVRLRLAREVSQLDLTDFVTATVFEDNDLALGNPNIRPDRTWVSELSFEQRFGRNAIIKLSAFHHWIDDVLDLLPLSSDFEAPGNIGDGRRWGLRLEGTVPLAAIGLDNAKLDLNLLWQDSTVIDPVTGQPRRLSGEGGQGGYRTLGIRNGNIHYYTRVDFRQDFTDQRVAWGWTVAERGRRPLYKVNEFDVNSDGVAVDAYIETTRWWGVKTRLLIENMLDFVNGRDRVLYTGERDLSVVDSVIDSDRHTGRRFTLYINGNF